MKNILCVLKKGGRYTAQHVHTLESMCKRHISEAFQFKCLTNDTAVRPDIAVPLIHDWPGWWSKLELFHIPVQNPTLYLDLDTVVLGDLSEYFVTNDHEFLMWQDPGEPAKGNSSLLSWQGDVGHLYQMFEHQPLNHVHHYNMGKYIGDQAFIFENVNRPVRLVKRGIESFKLGSVNPDTKLVMFHGKLKPWDVHQTWVQENYR